MLEGKFREVPSCSILTEVLICIPIKNKEENKVTIQSKM